MAKAAAETWQTAILSHNRESHQTEIQAAEQERLKAVERFPLDGWPVLPLERYALGQGKKEDLFCWWMEYGTPHVGSIKGGDAEKHLIYFKRKENAWYFNKQTYKDQSEAWLAIRAGFVDAFTKAQHGDWDGVQQVASISGAAALRSKALYIYFPESLLPIASAQHLRHFLQLVGVNEETFKGLDVVGLNRKLLATLRESDACQGWDNKELERFLYAWADPRDQQRVLKIAPGEDANLWPECLEKGYIRVGWGAVGNLQDFASKEEYRVKFGEVHGEKYNHHEATISKKANEVWKLRELEAGDLVVANHGTSKVLAVGEVVEPEYEWREHEDNFNHVVHVKWDTTYAQGISPQGKWAFQTVAPVSQALAAQILAKQGTTLVHKGMGSGIKPIAPPVDPLFREIADALERKGQVILYGPPGTGKTYTARRFAVWWAAKRRGEESPELLLGDARAFTQAEQRLSTAQVVRRVWWMVANPKEWNWNTLFKDKRVDYRYGRLQRNYPLVRKGDLVVGYQSTPDKKIVALAKVDRELHEGEDGEQHICLIPLTRVDNGPTYEELQQDAVLAQSEPMRFRNQGTLFALTEAEFDHLAALLTERNPELRQHLESSSTIGSLTRLTFHASYSYEDFIEGFRPVDNGTGNLALRLEDGIFKRICREAQANPKKTYVVLIDEINRANVAKVLGELITLLERDKRGLMISLPQSKETFTIPGNVYILGTMNTADRSIKLLDAALRRRFAFIELMPDSSLLLGAKIGNLALDEFLDELNHRIAAKEGREKQIGHSFLLDGEVPISEPEEFARRFRQEILPLLQEYCYEDYGVLAQYIGEKLVNQAAQSLNDERLNDPSQLIAAIEEAFASKGPAT